MSSAKTLVVSFVGMKAQEVGVKSKLNVILESDNQMLDEVMVVAYGTTKKSSFTGAASTVRGENIQKMQVSDISKSLEGSIAGVQTTSSSGTPGSSASIRIRGIGSISSSQEPLIVVDGVPYEGSLNSISTQDIESLTVLKDAAKNPVEFAGKYVFVSWGCGSGCINDGLLNVQTGRYSPLELGDFTHHAACSNTKEKEGQLLAKPNSRLLVVIGAKYDGSAPLSGEAEVCSARYYLENNGKIVPLK